MVTPTEDASQKGLIEGYLAAAATRAQDKAPSGTAPQEGRQVGTTEVENSNKLLPTITVYDVGIREIAGSLDHLLGRGTFQLRIVRNFASIGFNEYTEQGVLNFFS